MLEDYYQYHEEGDETYESMKATKRQVRWSGQCWGIVISTLKKVMKTYESLKATRMKARKVERPPLKTAGPISART